MHPMNLIYQQASYYALVHRKKKIPSGTEHSNDLHEYKISSCIAYKYNEKNYLAEIHENKFHVYESDDLTTYKVADFIEYVTCEGNRYKASIKNMSFLIAKIHDSGEDICAPSKIQVSDSIIYANWYDKCDIISTFAQWGNME